MNHSNSKIAVKRPLLNLVKTFLLIVSLFAISFSIEAQEKTIAVLKGVVKNDADELLTGATVSVKNTKLVAVTKDGTFELRNVPEGATLRITYVGYTAVEIKLNPGQVEVNAKLTSSTGVLNEVVVNTGLYKRPVGNFTGAAKTYTGDQLKLVNPSNVLQALATVEPSVRITQDNKLGSNPNQLPIIQIRGANNLPLSTQGTGETAAGPVSNGDIMSSYLLNPNQPLIILDGFQTSLQTIYDMDINRIASITVLKDAAATTAYGSKAANGVIVVETKQPVPGRTQITYSINMSIDVADLTSYHILNANGLLEAQRIAGVYTDANNHYNDVGLKQWYDYRLQQAQSGVNTDWLAQPVQNGWGFNHSLNISGGSKSVRYSLGLNYNNGSGVMKGSGRDRYGLNYNLSYISRNIRFSNNTTVTYARGNNTPWGSYSDYAKQFPFFKPYDSAGNVVKIFEPNYIALGFLVGAPGAGTPTNTNSAYNATLDTKDYTYYLGFTNNTNFDWTINNNLHLRSSLSFSNNLPGSDQFYPADHTIFLNSAVSGFTDLGTYTQTRGKNNVIDGKIAVDYNKRFGKSTIMTSVGFSAQETNSNSTTIRVSGIPNDYLDQLGLANGYGTSTKPGSSTFTTRSISSYASASYNYADRYTAEITANASGSSQFGSNNRLAPFWAGGVAWNVDKEKFFVKNPVIQQLKLRLTTGVTGNQNFAAYLAQPIFQYNLQNNYRAQLGATLQGYANPDLKWQQTIKNNFGLTAGLFNGKLNVAFDTYRETTDNLIVPLDVAPSTGFVNYQDNLGSTKNEGWEVSISSPIIQNRKKNIFWSLSFNTGHNKNIITRLSPAIDAINKANNDPNLKQNAPLPRYVVGESMSRIWAVKSLGIDPTTGKEVYQKLDGSQTFTWDPNDKQPVGDVTPKLKGMIASNLNYKQFTFNITLSYQYGGQMYNQTLVDKIENVDLVHSNADERVLTERWKQPGDHVSFKSLVASGGSTTFTTSRFVQDDNYIEASSITVGYTFPSNTEWVRKLRLSTPRFFITQTNLFRAGTIKVERGTSYPFSRSFNFGLSTTF